LQDKELIGELFLTAQRIAREQGVASAGYRLVFNVGKGGGQMIDHLHLHLLGGWKNGEEKNISAMP
jgi:histidine triad (HIT) family protein